MPGDVPQIIQDGSLYGASMREEGCVPMIATIFGRNGSRVSGTANGAPSTGKAHRRHLVVSGRSHLLHKLSLIAGLGDDAVRDHINWNPSRPIGVGRTVRGRFIAHLRNRWIVRCKIVNYRCHALHNRTR
jgi:hypothetical protein